MNYVIDTRGTRILISTRRLSRLLVFSTAQWPMGALTCRRGGGRTTSCVLSHRYAEPTLGCAPYQSSISAEHDPLRIRRISLPLIICERLCLALPLPLLPYLALQAHIDDVTSRVGLCQRDCQPALISGSDDFAHGQTRSSRLQDDRQTAPAP